jgi:hypothetical protein
MAQSFFLMGRSHLTALWYAWHNQTEAGGPPLTPYAHTLLAKPGMRMEFLQLESTRFEPLFTAAGAFHPAVTEAIAAARAEVHVSVLGGNDHSMIGVAAHQPNFDFVLPDAPDLPLNAQAQLVPAEMLREELARRIAPHLRALELLRAAAPGRVLHVESPPPLPEAHILRHPVPFAGDIAALGVAPALLRYKLWRLHSALYRDACARLGVEFLPAPPAMRDAAGVMLLPGCHPDATHGNALYGGHVLKALLEQTA